jgi:hypothetical protein
LDRHLPLGNYRVLFGLHDDPARLRGCRDYSSGDNIRKIHWPNSARTGQLQVKEHETTLNAQIFIYLNQRESDFPIECRHPLSELGIELAASLIHQMVRNGEEVGFACNGVPFGTEIQQDPWFCVTPKRGFDREKDSMTYLAGVTVGKVADDNDCRFFKTAKLLPPGSCPIFISSRFSRAHIQSAGYLHTWGLHPIFLWLSNPIHELPLEHLKQFRVKCFAVERRRGSDGLTIGRKI